MFCHSGDKTKKHCFRIKVVCMRVSTNVFDEQHWKLVNNASQVAKLGNTLRKQNLCPGSKIVFDRSQNHFLVSATICFCNKYFLRFSTPGIHIFSFDCFIICVCVCVWECLCHWCIYLIPWTWYARVLKEWLVAHLVQLHWLVHCDFLLS